MNNPIGKIYQGKKSYKDTNMSRMKDKISLNIRMYLWDSELYHILFVEYMDETLPIFYMWILEYDSNILCISITR